MVGRRLMGRLGELERQGGGLASFAWIVRGDESEDDAIARHEAKHGPLSDRCAVMWLCTGVPRGDGVCA